MPPPFSSNPQTNLKKWKKPRLLSKFDGYNRFSLTNIPLMPYTKIFVEFQECLTCNSFKKFLNFEIISNNDFLGWAWGHI